MKKPGRNDLCFCNSGKKFKHCHLDIERAPAIDFQTVMQALASFKKKKQCSVPSSLLHECSIKIINAHTVSKSSSLKKISTNGHVLQISIKAEANALPKIELNKVGINNASTFSGFCSAHDKSLFSPIEDNPFSLIPHHCFLVTYRGISRELFSKEYASKVFQLMKTMDKGKSLDQQKEIQATSCFLENSNDLTTSDLNYIKSKLDQMLISSNYSDLNYTIFTLDSPPPIMGSSIVAPTFDFNGHEAQKFSSDSDNIPDYIAINSFSSENKGYVVLSWLSEHSKTCNKIVNQFLERKLTSNNLAIFIILLIENFYISPSWWDSLNPETQNKIKGFAFQGIKTITFADSINTNLPLHFPLITDVFISHPQI